MYAELHCHTNFSFLDGASHPEELVEEAARLGLSALARHRPRRLLRRGPLRRGGPAVGLPTVFGAELTLGAPRSRPTASPIRRASICSCSRKGRSGTRGSHGDQRRAARRGEGRAPLVAHVARRRRRGGRAPTAPGEPRTTTPGSCSPAAARARCPRRWQRDGPAAAERALHDLVDAFGRDRVLVELWDHGDPLDRHRNDALARIALRAGVEVVATNNVHYATPSRRPLATALAAVRARRSLDEIDGWLPAAPFAHLRSPAEQARRFARWPGAVERTVEIAPGVRVRPQARRARTARLPGARRPHRDDVVARARPARRGGRATRRAHPQHDQALRQIDYELRVIEQLGFPGYFLLLHDIVEFCRRSDIYCQGRGSAANSAVCYALGVTKADAVALGLLFERFLSPERDGPPDIDLDIEHQRREEVIQYVYERYGRDRAAQVANVITYRPRSALREMAKAAGLPPGQADALGKWVNRWAAGPEAFGELTADIPDSLRPIRDGPEGRIAAARQIRRFERSQRDARRDGEAIDAMAPSADPRLPARPRSRRSPLALAAEVIDFPRHLGIHSGGMVMADRPLVEFCPVEWARMEGRSVLQWDKDDCAAAGLVKFDLLGLGMLTMLHLAVDMIRTYNGVDIDIATIPQEPEVYDLLCAADTVGVFQVESRAQMATLPRLRPRTLLRPRRRSCADPSRPDPRRVGASVLAPAQRRGRSHVHPSAHRAVPAQDARRPAVPGTAHAARGRLCGLHRGRSRPAPPSDGLETSARPAWRAMRERLMEGMAARGITGDTAEEIYTKLEAFSSFGFPESHSVSFAYLVYSSSWMKYHYPAEFAASLLNAQPMGFYSPHTIVRDARRHGVQILGPDLNGSRRDATLEPRTAGRRADRPAAARVPRRAVAPGGAARSAVGARACTTRCSTASTTNGRCARSPTSKTSCGALARPSIRSKRSRPRVRSSSASASRAAPRCGPRAHSAPRARRCAATASVVETLPGVVTGNHAPQLPGMTESETVAADLWAMGISVGKHPTEFVRERTDPSGRRDRGRPARARPTDRSSRWRGW